jgi:ubiquinone/menaquinone biosynthesis C-methylase UbiE
MAIDLEGEMIAVGQHEAAQRGVTTITWKVGKAEDLQAPPASFELITIEEAFHRLDQQLIATQALQWLANHEQSQIEQIEHIVNTLRT